MQFARMWIAPLAMLIAGCGGGEKSADAPPPAAPPATADLANGATVTGRVAFIGAPPPRADLDMSANPWCARVHPKPAKSEEVVVNPNGTLRNVFVRVKSGLAPGAWTTPPDPVVMDQSGCVYQPHVAGVMTGQAVEFRNSDMTNHNIHPLSKVNQEWNESQPPKGEPKLKSFPREEVMVPLKCNVHPWMRAYLGVVPHPFFAVSGDDGTFTIRGLPPGTYQLEAWHEKYGLQEQTVTVGPKETKSVDFSYKE
jgi:plastocyanin